MTRGWYARFAMVLAVCLLAAYLLFPSYVFYGQTSPEQRDDRAAFCKTLPVWSHCKVFNLGLDLQGGVHLVMGVRVDKALEHRADRIADVLRQRLTEDKIPFSRVDRPRDTSDIVVSLAPEASVDTVSAILRKDFSDTEVASRDGQTLTLRLSAAAADYVRTSAVDQVINVIRNRADKLGVTEPTIAKRGADNVLIQLPGVKNPERAIDVIGRTAQLEFKIVDDDAAFPFTEVTELPEGVTLREETYTPEGASSPKRDVYFEVPAAQREALAKLLTSKLPDTRKLAYGVLNDSTGKNREDAFRTYVLESRAALTGDYLKDAYPQQDPNLPSRWQVSMSFDLEGGKRFEEVTGANVHKRLAIVLDDVVSSAPSISTKISGGNAVITLGGAGNPQQQFEEAKLLGLVLKSGALQAPVEIREKRQVGRSLGDEAIHSGIEAILIGSLLVFAFMFVYYRWSGLVADIALALNVIFSLAMLAMFEATLTLPGMAGIVLSVAMAVDANVIIFERVREELRVGKPPRAAIEAGYDKGFSSIFDSNVTGLIAGIVLMQYGTGPVRGFAVTLIIGIVCSFFTATTVTRLIFDFFTNRRRLTSLSV